MDPNTPVPPYLQQHQTIVNYGLEEATSRMEPTEQPETGGARPSKPGGRQEPGAPGWEPELGHHDRGEGREPELSHRPPTLGREGREPAGTADGSRSSTIFPGASSRRGMGAGARGMGAGARPSTSQTISLEGREPELDHRPPRPRESREPAARDARQLDLETQRGAPRYLMRSVH